MGWDGDGDGFLRSHVQGRPDSQPFSPSLLFGFRFCNLLSSFASLVSKSVSGQAGGRSDGPAVSSAQDRTA
jgi:hypothetical protein